MSSGTGITTYRGRRIEYAVHDRKADTYALMSYSPASDDMKCVAELKAREFLAIPNRNQLEVRSGRHRGTSSKDNRSANRKSGRSWLSLADAISQYDPGAAKQGSSTGLVTWPSFKVREEKPKPPLRRESIIAGEIVGYRCWRIEKGLLHSVYQRDKWTPGEILEGRELEDWNERGVHAWKDAGSKQYREYIRSYLNDVDPFGMSNLFLPSMLGGDRPEPRSKQPAMITGTVFLWGDVVEHERGWRAEYARVRSLDWLYPDETMMGREEETLHKLRAKYGVLS